MLTEQPYLNKDIPLQVIINDKEGLPKITTQICSTKSSFIKTVNEKKRVEMKHNMDSHLNHQKSNLCHDTNKNIKNADNLPQISISNENPITFRKKLKQIILKYCKWPLIALFVCLAVYIVLYVKKLLPFDNRVYNSSIIASVEETAFNNIKLLENTIDSKAHLTDRNVEDKILKGSTTLLRPVIIPHFAKSDFIEDIQFVEVIQNGSSDKNIVNQETNSVRKITIPQDDKDKSDVLSQLGFTSGHQNNFGIPIEEDERILNILNAKLHLLDVQVETLTNQTESTLIVSPTLPLILHKPQESSTRSGLLEEIRCKSTSLHMCRGVLQYDLTIASDKSVSFSPVDEISLEHLFSSNCSLRAAQFVCSIMEPECRSTPRRSLQPCKRFCKSILEACSALIVTSDILTYMFDCDKYPDSNDNDVCEDPTRRGKCYENEFKCQDLSCIPRKWLCDNIKDCEDGEDEINCLTCDTNEFRCRSNDMCLRDMYRCDLKEHCSDGSDEQDCDALFQNDMMSQVPKLISILSLPKQNYTNRDSYSVLDDDRLPAESEFNESVISTHTYLAVTTEGALTSSSSTYSRNLKRIDNKYINLSSITEQNYEINENDQSGRSYKTNSTFPPSCINDQLRCVSGKCITVSQLCDKVVDCPEGEDEVMCGYDENHPRP